MRNRNQPAVFNKDEIEKRAREMVQDGGARLRIVYLAVSESFAVRSNWRSDDERDQEHQNP